MTAKPHLMASSPKRPSTTIDYAGCVSKSDLKALANHSLSAPQARYLAHALAVAVDDEVRVTHVDIDGTVRHFVVSAGQAIPDDLDHPQISVLVST